MDSKNASRIKNAISALNSVTTEDSTTARWIIDVIDQLEEVISNNSGTHITEWRERLGASDGR